MADTITGGGNLDKIKKEVRTIANDIRKHKADRTSSNEEIAALRAKAETFGISKRALDWAMKYGDLDPEDREGFDLAYSIVREAIGVPISNDLFDFGKANAMRELLDTLDSSAGDAEATKRLVGDLRDLLLPDDKAPDSQPANLDEARRKKAAEAAQANEDQEQAEGADILNDAGKPKQSKTAKAANKAATGVDDKR